MSTIDNLSSPLSETDHRAQLRRAVIARTVGTTIEWYDFFLYGQATGLVFGKLFFPKSDPLVGVLQAFAIYAVGNKVEVYVDGGIRRGTDLLKAIACGARAVFIGRPVLWGLASGAEAGVRYVLEMLRQEFDLAMALSGCPTLESITPDLIRGL
jgi:FMN-dependent dehydrogenase